MGQEFTEIMESDKSLKHELGFNVKILLTSSVLLALW